MKNKSETVVNPLPIPKEILNYTFTFFGLKQIVTNRQVCKIFRAISDDIMNKKKNEHTYYTVGNPILIVQGNKCNPNFDLSYNIRKTINSDEIIKSLKSKKEFMLFKTKEAALEYAYSLMTGDTTYAEDMYHPAIFEVLYLGEKNFEASKSEIVINQRRITDEWDLYENMKKLKKSPYLEAEASEILPISGSLEIKLCEDDEVGYIKKIKNQSDLRSDPSIRRLSKTSLSYV